MTASVSFAVTRNDYLLTSLEFSNPLGTCFFFEADIKQGAIKSRDIFWFS